MARRLRCTKYATVVRTLPRASRGLSGFRFLVEGETVYRGIVGLDGVYGLGAVTQIIDVKMSVSASSDQGGPIIQQRQT